MLPLPRTRLLVLALSVAVAAGLGLRLADDQDLRLSAAANTTTATANPITPGHFTGKGFDQCEAPSQSKMTTWLKHSPYRAVGIYISGSLRYCQAQTNLTPTWVRTQLATGWRLLPIHLGAQAACSTRDRYQKNKINDDPTNDYAKARAQGRNEADIATAAAQRLGIVEESTLFYDLEAFSIAGTRCRVSALKFLSAWTNQLKINGYLSGVYSSAASGIKALDDARVTPGNTISMPYHLWIADWDHKANTSSTYIRPDGWQGRRLKQYRGGHNETWGGVTINIDNNYLDLRVGPYTPAGPATPEIADPVPDARCTTTANNHRMYRETTPYLRKGMHPTLQCLLKAQGFYPRPVTGNWNPATTAGVKQWQAKVGHRQLRAFSQRDWVSLLVASNSRNFLSNGARGADVIRVQRALNAAGSPRLTITGHYDRATIDAVKDYQRRKALKVTGTVGKPVWIYLEQGRI